MKTIKQIADELGVSKTAVRKKIENLGLRSSLQKNGNQFAIDEAVENRIKQAFSENEAETKTETSSRTETETVSALVSMLQKELDSKNEQIAQLQKLLDQEQQLHAMTKQQLLQIQQKEKELQEEEKEERSPDAEDDKSYLLDPEPGEGTAKKDDLEGVAEEMKKKNWWSSIKEKLREMNNC